MLNFKAWFFINEAKKPAEIALDLVGGDGNFLIKLGEILPDGIKVDEKNKYLLIAAYFSKTQSDLNMLKRDMDLYYRLVGKNKMKLFTFDDKGSLNIQFSQYSKYLEWTAAMHGMEHEESVKLASRYRPTDEDFSRLSAIFENRDGSIKIYRANNVADAIILGKGTTFCISQPGNKMYKSYRDSHEATFYFVFDKNRQDDLDIVVVDIGTSGNVLLTDRKNKTGTCEHPDSSGVKTRDHHAYFNYLKKMGVDLSIFENVPHNDEEQAENTLLGSQNQSLQWFISLLPAQKSSYIGRGHILTDEQFNFLLTHKLRDLLEQYVSTGLVLNDFQVDSVLSDRELAKKYIHNRLINVENDTYAVAITNKEFDYVTKYNTKDIRDKIINKLALDISNGGGLSGLWDTDWQVKLFNSKDKILMDELWSIISKKIKKSMVGSDFVYNISLNNKELDVLKSKDPELYKSVLIHISGTGAQLDSARLYTLSAEDFQKLHPYKKMMYSFDSGDEIGFNKYFDAGGHNGAPVGTVHPDNENNSDDNDYSDDDDEPSKMMVNMIVNALGRHYEAIADHILNHQLKNLPKDDSKYGKRSFLFNLSDSLLSNGYINSDLKLSYFDKILKSSADNYADIVVPFIEDLTKFVSSTYEQVDLLISVLEKLCLNLDKAHEVRSMNLIPEMQKIVDALKDYRRSSSLVINSAYGRSEVVNGLKQNDGKLVEILNRINRIIDGKKKKFELDALGDSLRFDSSRGGKTRKR